MRFSYQCQECAKVATVYREHEDRNASLICPDCRGTMERVFSLPYLTTQPWKLNDENKFGLGFSETERTATRKADDVQYAKNHKISPKDL